MLRIVGVDPPQITGVTPFQQQNVAVADTTTENLQGGDAAQLRNVDVLKQEAAVLTDSNTKIAASMATRAQNSSAGLADLFNTTGKIIDRWTDIRGKEKATQLKADQEQAELTASVSVQDALFGMREGLQREGYKTGLTNARETVRAILSQNPNLSAAARKEIALSAYRHLDDLDRDFFKNSYEDSKDIKRQQTSQAESTLRLKTSDMAAAFYASADKNDPEAVKKFLDEIEKNADEVATTLKLDDVQRATFKASTLKYALESADASNKVRQEGAVRMNNVISAQSEYASIETLYQTGAITYKEREELRGQVKNNPKYKGLEVEPVTELGSKREANELQNLTLALQEGAKKGFLLNEDVPKILEAELTAQALALFNDPSNMWKYEQRKDIDSQRVLSRYKQLKEEQGVLRTGEQKLAGFSTRANQIRAEIAVIKEFEKKMTPELMLKFKEAGRPVPDFAKRPQLEAELAGLGTQYNTAAKQLSSTQQTLKRYGIDYGGGAFQVNKETAAKLANIRKKIASGEITSPGFNRGQENSPAAKSPVALLPKLNGMYVPLTPAGVKVSAITSGFGNRTHPTLGGQRHHNGLDIGAPKGTPTTALRSGVIVSAGWMSGYGNTVQVRMDDGKYALYAHLDSVSVKKGDLVGQGQVVGKIGATGEASGNHLHLSIFNSATDSRGIDPVPYLKALQSQKVGAPQRGMGLPPTQGVPGRNEGVQGAAKVGVAKSTPPFGALLLATGGYVWGGQVYRPGGVGGGNQPVGTQAKLINGARPMTGTKASNKLSDYGKNGPTANYGYKQLADDKKFAAAIAGTANRLGFPAQWLVDVMAFETGGTFSPYVPNAGGSGAVGLIQFMPDTAKNLGTSSSALQGMNRVQQLVYVEKYFKAGIAEVGKFKRMDDVFSYIWGGGNLVRTKDENRRNIHDGDKATGQKGISYIEYINRIGEHAGRSYAHGLYRGAAKGTVHTRPYTKCTTCVGQMNATGSIIPHRNN